MQETIATQATDYYLLRRIGSRKTETSTGRETR